MRVLLASLTTAYTAFSYGNMTFFNQLIVCYCRNNCNTPSVRRISTQSCFLMEERRSWEYPECEHVFDFGIHGIALPGMFKHTKTPRRRQAAVLSPIIFDTPPTVYISCPCIARIYVHAGGETDE